MTEQNSLSARLSEYRKNKGLSQSEVAELVGVSRQAVGKWEKGDALPSCENILTLAKIYKITLETLLTGAEFEGKPSVTGLFGKTVGERITYLRNTLAISQGELALALSVSRQSVSKWERGDSQPDIEKLTLIAGAFSFPVSLLLEEKTEDTEATTTKEPDKEKEGANEAKEEPVTIKKPLSDEEKTAQIEASDDENDSEETPTEETLTEEAPSNKARKNLGQIIKNKCLPKTLKRNGKRLEASRAKPQKKAEKSGHKMPHLGKKLDFKTISELSPNDPAYVFVDKNNGKLRTMLPFFAAIPICTTIVACVIKKEFDKSFGKKK